MAKKYRVELKPLEPYFFAGEKVLALVKRRNKVIIIILFAQNFFQLKQHY